MSRNTNSRLLPSAPLAEEWDNLLSSFSFDGKALLDVVVPVYKGRDETLRCLFSVLATAHENPTYRLVVINDKIPDPELAKQISKLAAANAIDLIENEENLGFIRSINAGISAHPDRDVIILNSDTEVFGDWARRLRRTAYSEGKIASVTPLSNNAEICSYPRFVKEFSGAFEVSDAEIDRFAAEVNDGKSVVIPTGVGFCMYMRREAIDKIGGFDHDQFDLGYGEENDWCRRVVRDHGMRNLLACDVFVRHYGGTSFGAEKQRRIEAAMRTLAKLHPDYHSIIAEFIRHDPIRPFRKKIDAARLRAAKRGQRTWLMICHNRGGGTERHLQEMLTQLVDSGDLVIVCRPLKDDRNWITFTTDQVSDCESLTPLIVDRSYSAFSEFIRVADIDVVHAQHLIDFPFSMSDLVIQACKETKCHLFVTVHDYHTVCPRITMVNGAGLYCGEPDLTTCEGCILRWGSEFGYPSVWEWRTRYGRLFGAADGVFAPNIDAARRMSRYFPEIEFKIRPHIGRASNDVARSISNSSQERHVLIIGAISHEKGSGLIEEVARYALYNRLPIRFTILGMTDRPMAFATLSNVTVTGRYEENFAVGLARNSQADFAWFPAIWPETFSYTLSIAFEAGVFPIAFDFGAIAERIRASGFGLLLPLSDAYDVPLLAKKLCSVPRGALEQTRRQIQAVSYSDLARDYYQLA